MFDQIKEILIELLDVEADAVCQECYLVRDLGMESIDFLELAVSMSDRFNIEVRDEVVFLNDLRLHQVKAQDANRPVLDSLIEQYKFLSKDRLQEILDDLDDGPAIQVRDLVSYIQCQIKNI